LPLSPVILFWLYSAVYMIYGLDACQDPANVTQIPGIDFPDISASTCDWGTAATFNICAVVCWLGCGFLLCCTPQVRILTTWMHTYSLPRNIRDPLLRHLALSCENNPPSPILSARSNNANFPEIVSGGTRQKQNEYCTLSPRSLTKRRDFLCRNALVLCYLLLLIHGSSENQCDF
jgi:hypothetical protein